MTTAHNAETLLSILTGEMEWFWDTECNWITFKKDGTGHLRCGAGLCIFISADFEWKLVNPDFLDQVHDTTVTTSNRRKEHSQLISQFDVEITLFKRRPELFCDPRWISIPINDYNLGDEAFRPKRYTIRLEKGNFFSPGCVQQGTEWDPWYALRLTFDKSPYPPKQEWKRPDGPQIHNPFWELVEFCGRSLPMVKKQGWSSCIAS
ncbi:hypothetical protein L228DRAFT_243538 [Xylona heveae TC161]|uniref:Uncharacterized protein n=1 Tax=Xylona heveae (strain CBS 132557 / TC161) TaxID=1328760 RepID=A0A165K4M3_XYLHT|nr:hypothetical protein L228DRAFT_243538 [Xylona heveae TC161]KZF26976.1 hypothetical protein L228DRAFT_243538 [Xylona heveae TC161]